MMGLGSMIFWAARMLAACDAAASKLVDECGLGRISRGFLPLLLDVVVVVTGVG